jgi:effector-binding domain-containing protein
MLTPAVVAERQAQPYVSIRERVTMQDIGSVLPPLTPQVFAWLGERGIQPAGLPFWKYDVIDMDRFLEVEVGVPVAVPVDGGGRVLPGVLPAGRYATLRHIGHPAELYDATVALLEWAGQEGLTWDMTKTENGEAWAARLEIYETNPADEPDMTKWVTQLAFRLAD